MALCPYCASNTGFYYEEVTDQKDTYKKHRLLCCTHCHKTVHVFADVSNEDKTKEYLYKDYIRDFLNRDSNILRGDADESQLDGSNRSAETTIAHEALKQALDIRKFEIELYWKRASYFWTFTAAIFSGYFLLLSKGNPSVALLCLAGCLGFIFTLCWYLVNKGSKFWQNNWERHVDLLEGQKLGPLYKTITFDRDVKSLLNAKGRWKTLAHISQEYPFSVSKINQMLSAFVGFIWFTLMLYPIVEIILVMTHSKNASGTDVLTKKDPATVVQPTLDQQGFFPTSHWGYLIVCLGMFLMTLLASIIIVRKGVSRWAQNSDNSHTGTTAFSQVDNATAFYQRSLGHH